jgi:Cys-rich repeat protein
MRAHTSLVLVTSWALAVGSACSGHRRWSMLDGNAGSSASGQAGARATAPGSGSSVPSAQTSCSSNAQCGGKVPICSATSHRCTPCRSNADCHAFTLVCDTHSGACVGCLSDTDCGGGVKCRAADNYCVPGCRSNADCGSGRTCDAQIGFCVECTTSADCRSPQDDKCDPGLFHCASCLAKTDCAQGSACNGVECVPACTSNTQCPDARGGCLVDLGLCAACVENSQCSESGYCKISHVCSAGH